MAIHDAASAAAGRLATRWPFYLAAIFICAVAWLVQAALKPNPLSKIPLVGGEHGDEAKRRVAYMRGANNMLAEGYRQFKDGIFRITTPKESPIVIVSPRFLNELRDKSDDVVSFGGAIEEVMWPQWTKAGADSPILPFIIKKDLTPGLTRLNPVIADEVDRAFEDEFPQTEEFTRVPLNHHLLRMVSKVSGRIFVGPELCHSEEYIDMSINYTVDLMHAAESISALPPGERAAKAPSLPALKKLRERQQRAYEFVRPLILERKRALEEDTDFQSPDDSIQWILKSGQDKYGAQDEQTLTEIQLALTFAAIHTTTLSTTNVFYTLAAMPGIVPELRQEIRAVLDEYGTFTTVAMQKMKKLDSFLRETMRVYPLQFASFKRKVVKPIVLSNGQLLPAGCIVEIASHSFSNDPDEIDDPETFDPLRSFRMREAEELKGARKASAGAANQMVTVSPSNLTFGYGRHACPGRFFAANEIKMIVGRALLNYDIALPEGAKERYQNIVFAEHFMPDPSKELMFRKVAV